MRNTTLWLYGISLFLIWSCSNSSSPENNTEKEISNEEEIIKPAKVKDEGQALYLKYCMACHQTDGSGVPGMYPPITNSTFINSAKKEELIKILLNGMKGPIEVNGQKYNQQMPKQDFLTDEQLSLIINFVSKSFGNNGSVVSPLDISAQRKTNP